MEHVIVAGGGLDDDTDLDDIEVLNWLENSHWRKVSIKLPVPMYNLMLTTHDDHLLIVGYSSSNIRYRGTYTIPLISITASGDQQHNSNTSTKWTELTVADHWRAALIPRSSPPVVVGGEVHSDKGGTTTADMKMYDNSNRSWKKIGSLSSARSVPAVAAVYDNAIIIIGGHTKGDTAANAISSSLRLVELGQALQ